MISIGEKKSTEVDAWSEPFDRLRINSGEDPEL
jgi:hypothetical protein